MPILYPDGNKSKGVNPVHFRRLFPMRFKIAEVHHGYYPFVLIPFGLWLMTSDIFAMILLGEIIILLGLYLFRDDWVVQHHRQVYEFEPLYHSPVHVFIYDTLHLYDNKYFRALNKALDWVFGLFK